MPIAPFTYQDPFPLEADETDYRLLSTEGIVPDKFAGAEILRVDPGVLADLAQQAFHDCSFMLRTSHLKQVASILDDPEASDNDRFVALTLLRNAEIAARGILPLCQDTGTATVVGKRGQGIWTGVNDAEWLSKGIHACFTQENLRYSQVAPLSTWNEVNTETNLPAQIDIYATEGGQYEFLFIAKGGGSANKTFLFQESRALLSPKVFERFAASKLSLLGTSACPPYHLVFVIGGTSPETCLKTVKLASTKYLDSLPVSGNASGRAFRDLELEASILKLAQQSMIGAQFGGKYFALDVRVVRLPRHGGSCPVGMGVSCSADRSIKARISREGIFLETMEPNPGQFIPAGSRDADRESVPIDLWQPMPAIRSQLSPHPVGTRLSLNGPLIVARDSAHAKLKERLDTGKGLPAYFKNHPIYYAGPAKTPNGYVSGSFGPTTAGRMDSYVEEFQLAGGSLVMLAKGNRAKRVTDACKRHGGFYLGSVGGPAAVIAKDHIVKVEVLEYPELGMEAIWRIEVKDFPAFILVDDKGNDFFVNTCGLCTGPN